MISLVDKIAFEDDDPEEATLVAPDSFSHLEYLNELVDIGGLLQLAFAIANRYIELFLAFGGLALMFKIRRGITTLMLLWLGEPYLLLCCASFIFHEHLGRW